MDERHIKDICAADGLQVAEINRHDDVLVITPAALEELSGADRLRRLADQLGEVTGVRYVTVAVDAES